MTMNWT